MKKIIAVTLAVLMLFSAICLTGCKEKISMTAEDFKAKMEAKGISVADATEQYADVEQVECVYIAVLGSGDHQIEFYQLDSEISAHAMFAGNKQTFEQYATGNHSTSSSSMLNYDRYTLNVAGQYMLLSRIDNTLIYVNSPADYKDEIKSILDEIGY